MNPECNVTRITAAGNNYRCNRSTGHSGEHRRTNANGTYVIYRWPQEEPPMNNECNNTYRNQGNGITYRCGLYEGHIGDHRSLSKHGEVMQRWLQLPPQEEPPKPQCAARHQQFYCTLPKDHTGNHEAHGTDGTLYHRWPATAGITTLPEHIKAAHPSMFFKRGVPLNEQPSTAEWEVEHSQKEAAKLKDDMKKGFYPVLFSTHELAELYVMLSGNHDIPEVYLNKIGAALKRML